MALVEHLYPSDGIPRIASSFNGFQGFEEGPFDGKESSSEGEVISHGFVALSKL